MARRKARLSPDLARAREQLEAWRGSAEGRRRVPRELWDLAVPLALKHGVSRTSTTLGLGYSTLKKHVEARRAGHAEQGALTFVEVSPSLDASSQRGECVVEFEDLQGTKMTVRACDRGIILDLAKSFLVGRG